mgnify:CR=1 FL=1
MKKAFLLLCALLLVLGSALPLAGYRLARAVLGRRADVAPSPASSAAPAAPEAAPAAYEGDADLFLIEDSTTGEVQQVPKRDYLIGAAAAEMPLSWPDEALKAQIVAAHSYALYCRDHASAANGSWLSADPARRQGYLTDAVLHSYWGTDYEANYARLSSLVDSVLGDVLCYDGAAAGTSYFALSNGRTEASENVWGSALPYLVPVDSSTDLSADNYEVTLTLSAAQTGQLLSEGLGIAADPAAPGQWFGEPTLTASGYVASARLRPDRLRRGPPAGTGAAERLLHPPVSGRRLLHHDAGLRPRRRPEPVGRKGTGRAGAGLCRHPRPLFPRHPALPVTQKQGGRQVLTTLFLFRKLSPEASSRCSFSSRLRPQSQTPLPRQLPLRPPERSGSPSSRRDPAPTSRQRCCWRCRTP